MIKYSIPSSGSSKLTHRFSINQRITENLANSSVSGPIKIKINSTDQERVDPLSIISVTVELSPEFNQVKINSWIMTVGMTEKAPRQNVFKIARFGSGLASCLK